MTREIAIFAQAAQLSVITAGLFQTVKSAQRIGIARVTTATVFYTRVQGGMQAINQESNLYTASDRLFGSGKMWLYDEKSYHLVFVLSLDLLCCHQNCCARLAPKFRTG